MSAYYCRMKFGRRSTVEDSDVIIETRPETQDLEPGDHERFAHYVRKEKIVESAVSGTPVTALCGKKWIPSRDPNKFPICPTCKEIHAGLRKGPDDDSQS
jgi:Protein of unknown function (DUF3039)